MQNDPYQTGYDTLNRRTLIKRLIVSVIGAIVLISVILTLTLNGVLDTSRIDKSYNITVYKLSDGRPGEGEEVAAGNSFAVLPAGQYAVQITKDKTEFHYSIQLTIQNFWRKATLELDAKKQGGAAITPPVAGTRYLGEQATVSFHSGGTVLFDDQNPMAEPLDTCTETCFTMQPYTDEAILGLLGEEGRAKRVGVITSNNTTPSPINSEYYPDKSQLVIDGGGTAFAVYDDKKSISYYADIAAKPIAIELTSRPALGESGRMISVAGENVAVLYGGDYQAPTSGDAVESTETPDGDYRLAVYSASTGKLVKESTIRNHVAIQDFDISPNADHFALITDNTVESGEVTESTITSVWPEQAYAVSWLTNDTFAYGTNRGLYAANKSTAWPLLASKTMTISNFSNIGGKLYATTIFTDDADQLSFPVIVDPNSTELANNLLSYTPIKSTRYYSIEFTGQEFHLYVPSLDDGTKPTKAQLQSAYDYMSLAAPDAKIVVFE